MKPSNKNKRKPLNYDRKRAMIIAELSNKYKVSTVFVHYAIRKERDSVLAEKIQKEYKNKYEALDRIIKD